ncbi:hypothetical protein ACWM35_08080 [Neobacillus sp. K501]
MDKYQSLPYFKCHELQESLTILKKQIEVLTDILDKDPHDEQYMEQFFFLKTNFDKLTQNVFEFYLKNHAVKRLEEGDVHIAAEVMEWMEELIKG